MLRYPAIALLEFDSAAVGTMVGDAMVKAAPIERIEAGTIQPGKHLVLVGGQVAAVEEAFATGMRAADEAPLDTVLLPDVHAQVHDAVFGQRRPATHESLGILETQTVAAVVRAADAAVKGALVEIMELRLGDGLGGKGLLHLTGRIHDVEAAIEIGTGVIAERDITVRTTIIPQLHHEMGSRIARATRFFEAS